MANVLRGGRWANESTAATPLRPVTNREHGTFTTDFHRSIFARHAHIVCFLIHFS